MHKRRDGQPHRGWRDAARRRHIVSPPAGLCECTACLPQPIEAVVTDAELFGYLDTLPRAQWAYAPQMIRAKYGIGPDRAIAIAKRWLKAQMLATPRAHGASLIAGTRPGLPAWAFPAGS